MPSWKKIITSGSLDASLGALFVTNAVTSSIFSGSRFIGASFTGSLFGTASFAVSSSRATTSSFALTSSFINVTGSNVFVQGGNSFGATALIGTNDNQNFAIETNGSTKVTVDTSGNVGIGNTSPSTFGGGGLTLGSTTTGLNLIINSSNAGNNGLIQFIDTAGSSALQIGATTNEQYFFGYGNRNMFFYTNGTLRMTISGSNGNVGIGTTTPALRLQVDKPTQTINATSPSGAFAVSSLAAGNAILELGVDPTALAYIQSRNIASLTTYQLLLNPNGGNVGIGTTSPLGRLDVKGKGSSYLDGLNIVDSSNAAKTSFVHTAGALFIGTATNASGADAPADFEQRIRIYEPTATTTNPILQLGDPDFTILQNGNVGIGSTSPTTKLEIGISNASHTNEGILLNSPGGYGGGAIYHDYVNSGDIFTNLKLVNVYSDSRIDLVQDSYNAGGSPGSIRFYTQPSANGGVGIERVRITSAGSMGIGTTTPSAKLQIVGADNSLIFDADSSGFNGRYALLPGRTVIGTISSGYPELGYNFTTTGGVYTKIANDTAWGIGLGGSNYMSFKYAAAGTGTFSWSTAMVINLSGNVGIGTTSPTEGKLVISNSGPSIIYNKETSQGVNSFWNSSDGGIVQFGAASNHPLLLFTNNTEKVRITSAGNVGIGNNSPTYKLDIVGQSLSSTAGTQELLERFNVTTSNNDYLELTNTRVSDGSTWETAGFRIQQKVDSTWMGYIQFNGNNNGGISFGTGLNAGAPLNIPEALRIVNGGNIGVRVTSPSSYLDIGGAQDTAGQISLQLRSGNSNANFSSNQITLGYNNSATYRHAIKTRHNSGAVSGNAIDFYTWKQSTDDLNTIGTQHVMSLDGPNVGIGVTSPTGKLHVSASGNPVIFVESDTDGDSTSTVLISGNKSGVANYTATTLELRSNIDYRGRGILMTYTGGSEKWFAGVPYTGGGYQIGYSTTAPYDPPNAALYINSSKNVGIGTTTPGQKLDVIGRLRFRSDTSTTPGFWLTGNDGSEDVFVGLQSTTSTSAFGVYSAASWRFTILNGGNVGIGTTNPQASLDVNGNILSRNNFALYNSNFIRTDSDLLYLNSRLGGRVINANTQFVNGSTTGYSIYDNNGSGAVTISVINEGTINNIPNSTAKAMKISYSAAATPSPGYGGFYVAIVNSTSNGVINSYSLYRKGQRIMHKIMANIPSGRTIEWASNAYGDNGFFTWLTSQSGTGNWEEYIGIQQIGTTGTFSSTGFYYISTGANTAFDWYVAECQLIDLDTPSEVQYSSGITIGYDTSYNSVTAGFGGLGVLGSVLIGGNLGVGTTGPAYKLDVLGTIRATGDVIAYSDARVKDNVEPIENALEKVISLRGVSYNRKDTDDKSRKIGVIAQEVLPIIPEVVSKDQNGNYSVAYGNMVGLLIEAVKEQQKQIDELKYLLENKKKKK